MLTIIVQIFKFIRIYSVPNTQFALSALVAKIISMLLSGLRNDLDVKSSVTKKAVKIKIVLWKKKKCRGNSNG
jgi:hypothetical protein